MEAKKVNWGLCGAAISVNFLSFGAGIASSWSSPVLPKLFTSTVENPFQSPISQLQASLIASLMALGAAIGPLASGFFADKIGRKRTLIYFSLPIMASYLTTAFATNIKFFYVARFVTGLGVGCAFSTVPMYIGEIAEDENRGLLGCLLSVMVASGIFFSYLIGPYVSITAFSLACVVPIVIFVLVFGTFIPESPYYYILVNKEEEAEKSLKKLRNTTNVRKELHEITKNIPESKERNSFVDLLRSKGLGISAGLMFFQQLSGISVILGYMQTIFDATGSNKISPELSAMITGFTQIVVSLLASQLVDRLGRKVLLIISLFGAATSNGFLGAYFYFQANGYDVDWLFWLPVTCLILFVFSYNFGIGPLAWAMMGELFPPNTKAAASTLTTFFSWMLSFLTSVFFPNLMVMFGMATWFFVFAVACVLGVVFVLWSVPETKGKSLQDIQLLLNVNKIKHNTY